MPNSPSNANSVWSPGKTVAWYGAIFAIDLIVQSGILLIATGYALARSGAGPSEAGAMVHAMSHDGQVFVAAAFASATLVISAVGLLTRRKGGSAFTYLAVRRISLPHALPWLGAGALFAITQSAIFALAKIPSTDFWTGIYLSSALKPLLFIVIVLVAPAAEEVMYRGFLFRGLLQSRLGPVGTVVLTSIAWASVHMQYNLWEKGAIFTLGLVLGTLRYRKHSLTIPFLIHAGVNTIGFLAMITQS